MRSILMSAVLVLSAAEASLADPPVTRVEVASLECRATAFRQPGRPADPTDTGVFGVVVARYNGELFLEKYSGHVRFSGYNGVFYGNDLKETPYVRASIYKNHYRFERVVAVDTFGSEQGMWGEFIISKAIEANSSKPSDSEPEIDAHYMFKAGDHLGGTVDFLCKSSW